MFYKLTSVFFINQTRDIQAADVFPDRLWISANNLNDIFKGDAIPLAYKQ